MKMAAVVSRLDAYLETLEQLYEEITQDEGYTEREGFSPAPSTDVVYSPRGTVTSVPKSVPWSKPPSKVETNVNSNLNNDNYHNSDLINNYNNNNTNNSKDSNYGVMPDQSPDEKKNYQYLPDSAAEISNEPNYFGLSNDRASGEIEHDDDDEGDEDLSLSDYSNLPNIKKKGEKDK